MKHLTPYITLLFACFLLACQTDDTVNFSYSPAAPRAGERISFSNLTDEGEEWKWTFGDEGESTVKNPTKVYKEAGTYTITLQVDEKKYRTCTKTITILDTIPMIACSADTLPYFTTVHFSAQFYNPNNEAITYRWNLPASAVVTSGDSASTSLSAYFTEKNVDVAVSLLLTIGTTTHTLSATYRVSDAPATALLCATSNGQLLRQRLYANGTETPIATNVPAEYLTRTSALLLHQDELYIVGDGIYQLNLQTDKTEVIGAESKALAGYLAAPFLYWADATSIHDMRLTTQTDNIFATTSQLIAFPHSAITALAQYTSLYLVAGDKGIYRFRESDINSGQAPATAAILSDYAITHLSVDEIARKLYFIAGNALYVSNIDGTNVVRLADEAKALTLNNASNRVYFATAAGVAYLPLVQTQNNTTTAEAELINTTPNVVAIAVDGTAR